MLDVTQDKEALLELQDLAKESQEQRNVPRID